MINLTLTAEECELVEHALVNLSAHCLSSHGGVGPGPAERQDSRRCYDLAATIAGYRVTTKAPSQSHPTNLEVIRAHVAQNGSELLTTAWVLWLIDYVIQTEHMGLRVNPEWLSAPLYAAGDQEPPITPPAH